MLGAGEFLRGLQLIAEREEFGALGKSFRDEREDIEGRRIYGHELLHDLKILFIIETKKSGERGEGCLVIVLGFEEQQAGAGSVDLGETEVEFGAQFRVGESLNFVDQSLSGGDGLLRYGHQSFGFESVEEGLIDGEDDVGGGGDRGLILGLGLQFGTGEQIVGAPKIGEELTDGGAGGRTGIQHRIVQTTSGDAATRASVDGGDVEIDGGQQGGALFADVLMRDEGVEIAHGNIGIIFQGESFGLR